MGEKTESREPSAAQIRHMRWRVKGGKKAPRIADAAERIFLGSARCPDPSEDRDTGLLQQLRGP